MRNLIAVALAAIAVALIVHAEIDGVNLTQGQKFLRFWFSHYLPAYFLVIYAALLAQKREPLK